MRAWSNPRWIGALGALLLAAAPARGATITFYSDASAWQSAVAAAGLHRTVFGGSGSNGELALADELPDDLIPGEFQNLGPSLTFRAATTGFPLSFRLISATGLTPLLDFYFTALGAGQRLAPTGNA